MRQIARINDLRAAEIISDFLKVNDIDNRCEKEGDGSAVLWILEDDQLDQARNLINEITRQGISNNKEWERLAGRMERDSQRQVARQTERMVDVRKDWHRRENVTLGFFTVILIGISIAVTLMLSFKQFPEIVRQFYFSEYYLANGNYISVNLLPLEIKNGQLWRLLTPIFLHFGLTHILFNMLWLKDLGSVIEHLRGSWFFLLLVSVIAVASNTSQYWVSGPGFGGMSGVVYGLFGYIWMMARFFPAAGFRLDKNTVVLMMVWLVVCYTGLVGPIANTAHTVGLVVGAVWGFVEAQIMRARMHG